MTNRRFSTCLALLVLLIGMSPFFGCSGGGSEEPAAEPAETPKAEAPKVELQTVSFDLELPLDKGSRTMRAGIPPGWALNPDFGTVVYQPPDKDDHFYPPVLQFSSNCGGPCAAEAIPGNIAKAIAGIKDTLARPNINTGDAELDAIRATVEFLLDEKFSDGGWILAAAVTYPAELSSALYVPKFVVHSFRHHPEDTFFVQTSAHAALDQKEALLATLIAACKSTEY